MFVVRSSLSVFVLFGFTRISDKHKPPSQCTLPSFYRTLYKRIWRYNATPLPNIYVERRGSMIVGFPSNFCNCIIKFREQMWTVYLRPVALLVQYRNYIQARALVRQLLADCSFQSRPDEDKQYNADRVRLTFSCGKKASLSAFLNFIHVTRVHMYCRTYVLYLQQALVPFQWHKSKMVMKKF